MADVDFKRVSLSKIVPAHRKTMEFTWLHRTFMLFGMFKDARTRMWKMTVVGYEHCRWCRKPFEDADMMVLAGRQKGGNVLLCQGCADHAAPSITTVKPRQGET